MKTSTLKTLLLTMAVSASGASAFAQIPDGYYDSLKGKKGEELKTALHNIIKNADVLDYGPGTGATWWGFYTTDNDNGYVIDRYSNNQVQFGQQGVCPSGMNIEHSFPKSWWGGTKLQAYYDLFNLMPSDSKANSSKSNYGMGEVKTASFDNGCIKIGTGTLGFKVWQPSSEWEGDFARGYMYMATAYQNYTWSANEALNSLTQGDYPTLKEWAYTLYIKWAKEDPVSETEVKRNNAVYKIQGNRNPYVDFPNLMEYVWGDSTEYAFDPATTVKSSDYNGGDGGGDDNTEYAIYTANYHSYDGGCATTDITQPDDGVEVWTRSSKYGWTASGSIKNSSGTYVKHNAEGYLVTPTIDLGEYSSATLSFTHELNFCTSPTEYLSVEVRCDGDVTTLSGFTWPAGTAFTSVQSGNISLDAFAGKSIQIAFHYTSTTSVSGTWEIENIAVTGKKASTGISTIQTADTFDPSKPYEAFDITGQRIQPGNTGSAPKGIIIVRQNGKTYKIAVK